MPKLVKPLTDVEIKNLKPKDKPYKKSAGDSLYIHVSPIGSKLWQMEYRYNGNRRTLSFGEYPLVTLSEARSKRDDARKFLSNGVDPAEYKKKLLEDARKEEEVRKAAEQNTFELVAREWQAKQAIKWSEDYAGKVLSRLHKDIFPLLGERPISAITAGEVLAALQKIEKRDAVETAHRVKQFCSLIFRYAVATGKRPEERGDPTIYIKDGLTPTKHGKYAAITDVEGIGHLLRDIDGHKANVVVQYALKIMPYVFTRPSELRLAKWNEFNFIKAEWRIPASRMKMKVEHIVPLAKQVIELLNELKPYTRNSDFLFPSPRSKDRPVTEEALIAAIRHMGYGKETMTVHGFRKLASTRLNEMGINRDWIERQLAHKERNKIRDAYNYAQYLPERRQMMEAWADELDRMRAEIPASKVIPIRAQG